MSGQRPEVGLRRIGEGRGEDESGGRVLQQPHEARMPSPWIHLPAPVCALTLAAKNSTRGVQAAMTSGVPQASTSGRRKSGAQVAEAQERPLVSRLTDAGEAALQRIAELPGGQRALGAFNDLRSRVDDLGKKVRGIEALEQRIAKLEKQVAELKTPRKTTTSRTSARRSSTPSS
jgi:hypothetical protein